MPSRLCTANRTVRARPHPRNPRAHPPPTPRSRRPDRRPVPHGLTPHSRSQPRRHQAIGRRSTRPRRRPNRWRSSRRTRIFTPSTRNSTIRPRHPPPRRRNPPRPRRRRPRRRRAASPTCAAPPRMKSAPPAVRLAVAPAADSNLPADATETVTTPPPTPGAAIGLALRVGILTVSDRAHARVYEDESGPRFGWRMLAHAEATDAFHVFSTLRYIVPDEKALIEARIKAMTAAGCNLVLTTEGLAARRVGRDPRGDGGGVAQDDTRDPSRDAQGESGATTPRRVIASGGGGSGPNVGHQPPGQTASRARYPRSHHRYRAPRRATDRRRVAGEAPLVSTFSVSLVRLEKILSVSRASSSDATRVMRTLTTRLMRLQRVRETSVDVSRHLVCGLGCRGSSATTRSARVPETIP